MRKTIQNFSVLIGMVVLLVAASGCAPLRQAAPAEPPLTQSVFISSDTTGYSTYADGKNVLVFLSRGSQYEMAEIKEGYARLVKTERNNLEKDVWVEAGFLENEPTYFLTLATNAKKPVITLGNRIYQPDMRLPEGNYTVLIEAAGFKSKKITLQLHGDLTQKVHLEEEIRIEKFVFIDEPQKLMWQDDSTAEAVKKPWITEVNYEAKNYHDTTGDTAASYCEALKLIGKSDWRLPSKEELKELFAQKSHLKNSRPDWYWSGSANEGLPERAWAVYFNNGDGFGDLKNAQNYVRCVRNIR